MVVLLHARHQSFPLEVGFIRLVWRRASTAHEHRREGR
jgi:hypothetical protein